MTSLETIRALGKLHTVAYATATSSTLGGTYREIAVELHETMHSISQGVDPAAAVADLQDLWEATSAECGSGADARVYGAWAGQLANLDGINYG